MDEIFLCDNDVANTVRNSSLYLHLNWKFLLSHQRCVSEAQQSSCATSLSICLYTNICIWNMRDVFLPQVIGTLRATDKDDQPAYFSFSLANPSSNFSIKDYGSRCFYLPFLFLACFSKRCSDKSTGLCTCCYATAASPFEEQRFVAESLNYFNFSKHALVLANRRGICREPVWDHKCCRECTTTNIENNESKCLGGLVDDSLCILNSS